MTFNSFIFWLVFPFIFGLYWLIPAKYNQGRKVFLIIASYLLYMNWKPAYALILIGITTITFLVAKAFETSSERKKIVVWGGYYSLFYHCSYSSTITSSMEVFGH